MLIQSLTTVYRCKQNLENSATCAPTVEVSPWETPSAWVATGSLTVQASQELSDNHQIENPKKLISDPYECKKMGEIWGYHVEGLFKTDKEAAEYQKNIDDRTVNNRVYSSKVDGFLRAGDVRFADLNGDGIIGAGSGTVDDPGDRMVIGNTTPRYTVPFEWKLEQLRCVDLLPGCG